MARTLFRLEGFNGYGYHGKGCNSPYLYGGSTLYGPPEARAGKFVRDHVFDPSHVDSQLGTAVVLRAMMALDSSITLDGSPQIAGRTEPEDDEASTIVLMQQALNRLGPIHRWPRTASAGRRPRPPSRSFSSRTGCGTPAFSTAPRWPPSRAATQVVPAGQHGDLSRS